MIPKHSLHKGFSSNVSSKCYVNSTALNKQVASCFIEVNRKKCRDATFCEHTHALSKKTIYSRLSIPRILGISNFSVSRTNFSVPWAFTIHLRKTTSRYLEPRYIELFERKSEIVGENKKQATAYRYYKFLKFFNEKLAPAQCQCAWNLYTLPVLSVNRSACYKRCA